MKNPLLQKTHLPSFKKILAKDIIPALDKILSDNCAELKNLLKQKTFTWENLISPLEDMHDRLDKMWSPIGHLNNVMNSSPLRKVYNQCLPKLSDYNTKISHNVNLYKAIQVIASSADYKKLDIAQKKVIQNELRDFKLAGITLSSEKKKCFAKLNKRLTKLQTKFEENLLDATHAWTYYLTDEKKLSGLPAHIIQAAKNTAQKKHKKGWILTLDFPVYYAVMSYADNRDLRKVMYEAYVTRASDQGSNAEKYDNTKIMEEILCVRQELAQLIGFKNYAEYSLATKMIKDPKEIFKFSYDLVRRTKRMAEKEFKALSSFAKNQHGMKKIYAWDISYYSEKLRQKNYAISQETLRPYFPEDVVLLGMFKLVEKLYGIKIQEKKTQNKWHLDVRYFEIYDKNKKSFAAFYTDLYARQNKRGGAWMDECCVRRRLKNGKIQNPVAYLTCNFSMPIKNKPSLLTHDEVITLFHEFGHCLQHLLTKIDYSEVSGINGVEWDAVELSSQFMENFCWQKPVLNLISKHHETGKKLSKNLYQKLIDSKNFQAGMQMMRQIEFALFDFYLHTAKNGKKMVNVQSILNKVRKEISVIPTPKFNRFQHGFSHIFAGGYAAGYYSYKWAEVLSSDVFSKFEEDGLFNKSTAKSFLHCILEQGGSQDAMTLFIKFRGRKPKINALLRHSGILLSKII